tara:strand:- start:8687 stop:9109 length:423 start_codon:yes stop_codon:yes gene_type:complete
LNKKKLSKEDLKYWKEFLRNSTPVSDKDFLISKKIKTDKIFKFDFHGFSIDEANQKIKEIIETCYNKGISQIYIITGKGIHSKSSSNVYVSETYSKLKNTIPDFLNNNQDLKSLILKIEEADENAGGSGALIIKLKKTIK